METNSIAGSKNTTVNNQSELATPSNKATRTAQIESTVNLSNLQSTNSSRWIGSLVNSMVPTPLPSTISVTKNEDNQVKLETADGYTIDFAGKEEAWTITAPNGTSTRIWGDPHVSESDGTNWDFRKQSSFIFGNNKITVETTPAEWNPGYTYSHRVTLHNGSDRITITDIEKNAPTIDAWRYDAKQHDESQSDGNVYSLKLNKDDTFSWKRQN